MSMQRTMRHTIALAMTCALLMTVAAPAEAVNVTGWWRMEADNDAGAGYSIANEVAGGSALTGSNGAVQSPVPIDPLPQPPVLSNANALRGNNDVNGSIADYAGLNVTSGTFEFFSRSNEGDARFLLRQSGTTGLRIDQPNNLRVQYSTAAGQVTLSNLNNFDANWDHVAFSYDEVTGVGTVYVNGVVAGSNDGPDNQPLTWPAGPLLVGNGQDGGGGLIGQSIFDELRIVDSALPPNRFLIGNAPLHNPFDVTLDIGPEGQRVQSGHIGVPDPTDPATPNHNQNGTNFGPVSIDTGTGTVFDLSISNVDQTGSNVGGIDWRDRGDGSSDDLVPLGEDFVKNNGGVVRLTLDDLPPGDYRATSFHIDAGFTQSDLIEIFIDNNGDGLFDMANQTGDAGAAAGGVGGLTTALIEGTSAHFLFSADGINPVVIVFDGRASGDDETPLNGLRLQFFPVPVPEPATFALLGLGSLAMLRRRRVA